MDDNAIKVILSDVKNYLDITWADARSDRKLRGIIRTGATFLQRMTSRKLRFEEGTFERSLLFDYCRYVRAGALDEFSKNYQTELMTFRQDEEVAAERLKAVSE
jgi:hypothetical protein